MIKNFKIIFFVLVSLLIFATSPNNVLAQEHGCSWSGVACVPTGNCPAGYAQNFSACNSRSESSCSGDASCILIDFGSGPGGDVGGGIEPVAHAHDALCGGPLTPGIQTALGCLRFTNSNQLSITLVRIGIGLAGLIALIMISLAAFQIMTSQGNPSRLENGKNLLYAAISGLIFISLSTFVLRFLGVDVLGLF